MKIQLFISPSIKYHFASAIIACVHFLQAIKCGLTGLWLNIGYFNFLLYETKSITVFLRPIERVFNVLWPIKRFIQAWTRMSPVVCVCELWKERALILMLYSVLHSARAPREQVCCLKGNGVNVAGTHGCLHRAWRGGGVNDVRSTAAHRRDAVLCYFLCLPDLKRFTVCWAWVPVCYQLFCSSGVILCILSHTCWPVMVVYHFIYIYLLITFNLLFVLFSLQVYHGFYIHVFYYIFIFISDIHSIYNTFYFIEVQSQK